MSATDLVENFVGGFVRQKPRQTITKNLRWRPANGEGKEPVSVEVVGSFTNWRKVPLRRDHTLGFWQVTLENLEANRPHRYMLLVDGQPVYDENCGGLAIPQSPEEEGYQLMTDRGPRVFLLFTQTR